MNYYNEIPPRMLAEYDMEFFPLSSSHISVTSNAHAHSALEILYFVEGSYKVAIDGEQIITYPGDMVMLPSNAVHSINHLETAEGQYYVLKLTSSLLFQVFKGSECADCLIPFSKRQNGDKSVFRGSGLPEEITAMWKKMIDEYNSSRPFMLAMEKAYAFELLILIYRHYFSGNMREHDVYIEVDPNLRSMIYESVSYINDNYASNITPYECAKKINLSYSYYAKLFHATVGRSFKEYLLSIRLEKAYNALISTDLPITEIAMCCGYKNSAYFSAEFKKHYGTTPSNVQKKGHKRDTQHF